MAITPWYKGDTVPSWTISLVPDSGAFSIVGLTAGSFALLIRNTDTLVDVAGTGSFSNLTAATLNGSIVTIPANIQYAPSSTDTSTSGNFTLFLIVTYGGGGVETMALGTWQVISK